MTMCGRTGETLDADEDIHKICDSIKPHAEEKAGTSFEVFTATSYRKQLVNGFNYFIKVHVGGEEYLHLRVYQTFQNNGGDPELLSLQKKKGKDEEIEYF